jgi:hypothetical protein
MKKALDPNQDFYQSLNPEEEQLIIIRDFLYDGDWEEVLQDLRARQGGKPFIFKLNSRIEEDIRRIERLRSYEEEHRVDLKDYLVRSGKFPELSRWLEAGEEMEGERIPAAASRSRRKRGSPAGS